MALYRHLLRISPVACITALILTVVASAATIAMPFLLGRTIGQVSSAGLTSSLLWALALIVAMLVAEVSDTVSGMTSEFLVRSAEKDLRLRIGHSFVRDPQLTAPESPETTGTATRLTESLWQYSNGIRGAVTFMPASVLTVAGLTVGVGVSLSWWFAVGLLATVLAHTVLVSRIISSQMEVWSDHTEPQRHATYALEQSLGPAAKELRVFGLGPYLMERHRSNSLLALQPWWRKRWAYSGQQGLLALVRVAAMVAALAWAARLASTGRLDVEGFTTAAGLVIAMSSVDIWGFTMVKSAMTRLGWLESLSPPADSAEIARVQAGPVLEERDRGGDQIVAGPPPEIVFDDVSFHYPSRERLVLDRLTWQLPAGEATALVGVNGAGKSTLVKLLTGGFRPTSGRILVDGVDLASFDDDELRAWQRRLAPITQDFIRLPLSAGDNVELGSGRLWSGLMDSSDHPHEELDRLASRAGLTDLVDRLPKGWATVLDKTFAGGTDLSGGEWQRIGLARALRAVDEGAGLLILDEPAAALDVESEARLVSTYLDLAARATSLLISHRFSVVRPVPRICVLDGGRIIEQGSHADLMSRGGEYSRLFTLQANRYRSGEIADEADLDDIADLNARTDLNDSTSEGEAR